VSAATKGSPDPIHHGAVRVALRVDDATAHEDVAETLRRRGVYVCDWEPGSDDPNQTVAMAPAAPLTTAEAAALAETCLAAAHERRPLVLLACWPDDPSDTEVRAAALGFLQSHGALVCADPSVWIETLVLTSLFGLPLGPRTAVVAPPGSLLAAQASSLAREHAMAGARLAPTVSDAADDGHDAVLVDLATIADNTPKHVGGALVLPVLSRGELTGDRPTLVDLRHAMAAVALAGELAVRIDAGLGTGPDDAPELVSPDDERFQRQLRKLGPRGGDHETKVLLSSYGIEVTRQAVATTPSAATRIAKKAGFPVDIKAWGPDVPSEADGCPVETDIETAADVRRAFAAATSALDLPAGAPVIVRATPPPGRELRVRLVDLPDIGWTLVARIPGQPEPIAAPAPLSMHDAERLASLVATTRKSDQGMDPAGLAELLVRVSYLVWDHGDRIESLDLGRVIVSTDDGSVIVADATCTTRTSSP